MHFDNMPKEMQSMVLRYIKDFGFEFGESYMKDGKEVVVKEGIATNHKQRDLLNLLFYINAAKVAGCDMYIAGNFPQMQDPEAERTCCEMVCKFNDNIYNRLVSFWYDEWSEIVIGVKKEIDSESKDKRT